MSNGDYHTKIDPSIERRVEVIQETPIYCKIPCLNEFSPWKITISYEGEDKGDLSIYTSLTNPMPSLLQCKRHYKNVKRFVVSEADNEKKKVQNKKFGLAHTGTNQFTWDYIYLTFMSVHGTTVRISTKFANEDGHFKTRKRFEKDKDENINREKQALYELTKDMSKYYIIE